MKKHIPNAITLLNLLSGLIALVYAFDDNIHMAFLWVCIGIFFDYWDGFVARILNVKSEMGLQLDSLADMVTSGELPLFSLKIKPNNLGAYKLQIGFVILSLVLLITLQYLAIPIIILVYILLSIIKNMTSKQ